MYEGTLAYDIFTNKTFVSTALILTSATSGFGQALMWVGLGQYITLCATPDTLGYYFGLNYTICSSSFIFGNLFNAYMINKVTGPSFFLINGLMMIFISLGYCFLIVPEEEIEIENDQIQNDDEGPVEKTDDTQLSVWQLVKKTF